MTSPVPRRLYEEHLRRNHPSYLQWDNRTKTLSVPVIIADIAFLLLLVGSLSGDLPSGDTSVFGSLLAISLAVTSALLVVRLRGKRGFQRVWIEEHGPPLGTGSDSSPGHETPSATNSSRVTGSADYFQSLSLGLSEAGFAVRREEKVDPYLFEIVAVMPANRVGGFRDLVIATSLELPTLDNVEEFYSLGMKYALDNKSQLGLGSADNLNLYSVIVSNKFSDEVKRSISATAPRGSSMHGRVGLTVLAATAEQQIYYYTKTPIHGGLRYVGLRNFADTYFSFQSGVVA